MEMPVSRLGQHLLFNAHWWGNKFFGLHTHACFEIMIATADGGEHRVNDRTIPLRVGDVYLLGHHHVHEGRHDRALPRRHFNIQFLPEVLVGHHGTSQKNEIWRVLTPFLNPDFPQPLHLDKGAMEALLPFCEQLVALRKDTGPYRDAIGIGVLQALVFMIARHYPVGLAEPDPAVLRTLQHIGEGYQKELTTEHLARAVGLGPSRLAQRFRQVTGRTVKDVLTARRLQQARRLLSESSMPVTEVMVESGFNDLSYFNRAFKKANGCSPRGWRNRLRPSVGTFSTNDLCEGAENQPGVL